MARPPLQLVIGNYNTSSWSLRASLVLRLARFAFVETRIPLRREETRERIARFSPSGKLPVLIAEGVPIWDSLAIAEFVAELEPSIWPIDPVRRAEARAISAEMHSGFAELRRLMPMDIVSRFTAPGKLPRGLAADIERIEAIWQRCRRLHAADGPFLFGAFSVADAMMAPVAARFVTHGVPVAGPVEDYVDSVMAWPDMVDWCDAAAAEQEERAQAGSLGVVEAIRPGRVLDGNGNGGDALWAAGEPADADDDERHRAAAAQPEAVLAAAVATEAVPAGADNAGPAPAETRQGRPQVEPPPAETPPADTAAAAAPSLDGRSEPYSIEPAFGAPVQAGPGPSEPGPSEPPAPPLPPLEAKGRAERAPAESPRKLGWIRRPVPAEHLAEVEKTPQPTHPLRRAAFGAEPTDEVAVPAATRDGQRRPIARETPDDQPAAPSTVAAPDDPDGDGDHRQGAKRPDAAGRPPAPAVKPIGSGILRRR